MVRPLRITYPGAFMSHRGETKKKDVLKSRLTEIYFLDISHRIRSATRL